MHFCWMPTKNFYRLRAEQLKRELERATEERDTERTQLDEIPKDAEGSPPISLKTKHQEMSREVKDLRAEIKGLETRLEEAESESQRWREREQRWAKLEEKLEQEKEKLAQELADLRATVVLPETATATDPEPPGSTSGGSGSPEAGRVAVRDQSVPTIPKYSGVDVGEEDETIEDWMDQFQLIADVFEWDNKTRLMHLVTHLKGSALAFYRSCSPAQRSS